MGQLVDAGKVRYVGISNYSAGHLMTATGVAHDHGLPHPVSQHSPPTATWVPLFVLAYCCAGLHLGLPGPAA